MTLAEDAPPWVPKQVTNWVFDVRLSLLGRVCEALVAAGVGCGEGVERERAEHDGQQHEQSDLLHSPQGRDVGQGCSTLCDSDAVDEIVALLCSNCHHRVVC